jgi:hypothetical protein
LKSTFNYHPIIDMTAKIDLILSVVIPDKADSERLVRLQGHEKFDCAYDGNARILAPLVQSCEDFIEDHHPRHNRRPGEMPGQAGMIRGDRSSNFKVHLMKFGSSDQIEQPG